MTPGQVKAYTVGMSQKDLLIEKKGRKAMAVTAIPLNAALVVVFQTGLSPLGAPTLRQKSLSSVRFDTDEQALYDAAHALFSLSQHPVIDVLSRKTYELAEE